MAPFGYLNSRGVDKEKIIVIDEGKAVAIRAIFKALLDGAPLKTVASIARGLGFKNHGNGNIQRVLRNPVYAGLVRVPAYKGKPSIVIKAKHSPIVSEGSYWQAQDILDMGQKDIKHLKDEVFLRGVLRCNCCNRIMTAGNSKGKTRYYWVLLMRGTQGKFQRQ